MIPPSQPQRRLLLADDDREVLKKTIVEEDLTWRSFWDGGSTFGPIASHWNVQGWPTVYLIDHEGVIKAKGHGGLDSQVEGLVEAAEAALKTQ